MKFDIDKIRETKYYASCLEKGIDPTTNIEFKEDTILNMQKIKAYNKNVLILMDKLLAFLEYRDNKRCKIPFYLSDEQRKSITINDDKVTISNLCRKINEVVSREVRMLKTSDITDVLIKEGYLKTKYTKDGWAYRYPTEKGKKFGIYAETRISLKGTEYTVNFYNKTSQKIILNNLNNILYFKELKEI